ncbi:MAG TPA: SPOR domain-containing protein [Gemmatimonadaceae bacterium]|nr:SPOR domain-containing protein [Gemmatimonadaceae bacterium]
MRTTLLALALVLVACGRSDRAGAPALSDAPSASSMRGPDQIVLRFPRGGGAVRAFAFPRLDSLVWTSSGKVPPLVRVLGFDEEAGTVAAADDKGALVRVDLRLGAVTRDSKPRLTRLATSDGSAVYGIDDDGGIVRLTPAASWRFSPPAPARDVIPEPDGAILILADLGDRTTVWQMYPPARTITDTVRLPRVSRALRTQVGDRVYFTVDSGLVGLRSRGLEKVPSIHLQHHVRAIATTPSGDRLYVATDSSTDVLVIDRYTHQVSARIALPGPAAELRMDPTGRYVLAHPARVDSAWVIAVGTDHLVGAVPTEWRNDLPAVAPNGWIALLDGKNVRLVDGETLRTRDTAKGGAKDDWYFIAWNGFRPRASGLDEPVTFGGDSAAADTMDTTAIPDVSPSPADSAATPARPRPAPMPRDTVAAAPPADTLARRAQGFTVQFAAVRSPDTARSVASTISVQGTSARVVATQRMGITIYRVVLGPYPTRAEAERVARASGKSYWVYEGAP